jgi:hypothetical protein
MELSDTYCNEIIDLFNENSDNNCMDKILEILTNFQNIYMDTNNLDEDVFRKDTKKIFNLLMNTFAGESALKEFDNYWDEEFSKKNPTKEDLKEKIDYLNFTYDVRYVHDNIEQVNLKNPDNDFKNRCNNVINYLKQGTNDMEELKNTMKDLTNKLKEVHTILVNKS